jgi:hypothetical protein
MEKTINEIISSDTLVPKPPPRPDSPIILDSWEYETESTHNAEWEDIVNYT